MRNLSGCEDGIEEKGWNGLQIYEPRDDPLFPAEIGNNYYDCTEQNESQAFIEPYFLNNSYKFLQ